MNVVKFDSAPTMQEALEIVDALRKDVEEGRVVAFFVAAVSPEDDTIAYCAGVKRVSQLRLQGAMGQALHDMQAGELAP